MTTQTGRPAIRWNRILIYAILIMAAAFYLLPVYVLMVAGMKSFQEVSLARLWCCPRFGMTHAPRSHCRPEADGFSPHAS
jgi:glucose/mannose transport system permease protein